MRKIKIFVPIVILSLVLTGCGMFSSQIPDMTDEEHDMVVEYATKTLLSYDKKHGDKLKGNTVEHTFTPPIIEDMPLEEGETLANITENTANTENGNEVPNLDIQLPEEDEGLADTEMEIIDNTQDDPEIISQPSGVSSAEALFGIENNVSIIFKEYMVCDNYPESTESYFIMKASEGNKLVVFKFDLSNVSSQDVPIDVPSTKTRFKITLNGKTKNALNTMLINDFVYYTETLVPNESEEVVVVGEFPEEECADISSLALVLKGSGGSADIVLK